MTRPMSQVEVARTLGCSRQAVSFIELAALAKLRRGIEAHYDLPPYSLNSLDCDDFTILLGHDGLVNDQPDFR